MRYTLVDGQGNFGSIDGDPPAAYRYTEARLESLAEVMMADLDKETVDFRPNFDETTEEPTVLPTPFPNLLVNGSTGIAVGMATSIPPHNMREVIDGVIAVIEQAARRRRDERFRALLQAIPGSGLSVRRHDRRPRGHLSRLPRRPRQRRRARQGDVRGAQEGRSRLDRHHRDPVSGQQGAVSSPRSPSSCATSSIEGISDLRDESDRDGMRIVIELKRGELPDVVLNNLYKHTKLQMGYGITLLAIAAGRPRVLSLLEIVEHFIEFRREVVRRRIEFELRKAEARAHILEGLQIALDHLDRGHRAHSRSKNPAEARTGLMTEFGLTQIQAQAILDMQLQRLTGLERQKIARRARRAA